MTLSSTLAGFDELLDRLAVPRGELLYVQSSLDWIQRAGFDAAGVMSALNDRVGAQGTLVMPAYPFAGLHRDYLETQPTFVPGRTPAAIGLLPEIFRRTRGVVRGADPDFCVAALGPDASTIAGMEPSAGDPFGADSSYQRMLDRPTTVLGLGVSLNTSSFIHAIDSQAAPGYPAAVYEERLYATTVADGNGSSRVLMRRALRPPFQQLTSPSAIVAAMQPDPITFSTVAINDAIFFRWDLKRWSAWCLAHAADRASRHEWPCWLSRLAGDGVFERAQ